MRYVLAIKQPVYGNESAYLAYLLAEKIMAAGHEISQIFFFQNGVSNALATVLPASDEFHLPQHWRQFSQKNDVPLHLCISAAARRGVVEQNLADGFTLAGLGEFSQVMMTCDRLLTL
jgi:tRNA 2-thiouridine synthesizing protein D